MNVAFAAPKRKVTRVFLHCSASDSPAHDNIATIRKWHTTPDPNDKSKPWADVGYHYFIRKDGTLEAGRSLNVSPAGQGWPNNTGTIAICVSGLRKFTPAQFNTLQHLCVAIHEAIPAATFHGHKEVAPWKECPVFDYKTILSLDHNGNLP